VRPSDLELASELGAVRLARGDAPGAVTLFRAVVAGRPGDREAVHDFTGAWLQAGRTAAVHPIPPRALKPDRPFPRDHVDDQGRHVVEDVLGIRSKAAGDRI